MSVFPDQIDDIEHLNFGPQNNNSQLKYLRLQYILINKNK